MNVMNEPAREVLGKGWGKEDWMEYWKYRREAAEEERLLNSQLSRVHPDVLMSAANQLTENTTSADINFSPP